MIITPCSHLPLLMPWSLFYTSKKVKRRSVYIWILTLTNPTLGFAIFCPGRNIAEGCYHKGHFYTDILLSDKDPMESQVQPARPPRTPSADLLGYSAHNWEQIQCIYFRGAFIYKREGAGKETIMFLGEAADVAYSVFPAGLQTESEAPLPTAPSPLPPLIVSKMNPQQTCRLL